MLFCIAQPRRLCPARIGMAEHIPGVPVDANAAEADRRGKDTQSDRVQAPIFKPPIGGHTVAVTAIRTAASVLIALQTAVAGSDLDLLPDYIPDTLELLGQLRVYHLSSAAARAVELVPAEILRQRGFVAALIGDNTHASCLLIRSRAFEAAHCTPV